VKLILGTIALVLGLDQFSKLAIVHWLDLKSRYVIDVLPPFLSFRMAWNQGVNFGLFANSTEIMRWVLTAIAVGVSIWLFMWARKMTLPIGQFFAGCVIGGALGNAIDRAIYGAVADFLNVSCCGLNNPYAFNVADIAIFLGAFGLVLVSNRLDKHT
jgi:signal peptidase II